jgi:hypothetical protein
LMPRKFEIVSRAIFKPLILSNLESVRETQPSVGRIRGLMGTAF